MARITGAQTRTVFVLNTQADAWGTAQVAGAGDRIRGNITPNIAVQELIKNPIGGGLNMQDDIIAGRVTPVITLAGDAGFLNGYDRIAAQFFSAVTAAAEITSGEGDYLHRFTMAATANDVFGTFAFELTSDRVMEFPTVAVRSFTTSFSETHQILQVSAEMLGNEVELATAVNTNAAIGSATTGTNGDLVAIVKLEDDFWLNEESDGALDSGDQYDILSYTRTLNRPQEFSGLVKGSAGNPEPKVDQLMSGTLTIVLESLDAITRFTDWQAGTSFKCKLNIEGEQIASGENFSWAEYCPKARLVQAPSYKVTESGYNTVTLNAVLLEAASAPTGMSSTRPYLEIVNTKSTNYILAS